MGRRAPEGDPLFSRRCAAPQPVLTRYKLLEIERARFTPLRKALSELRTSIVNNRHLIPNYGQRYHQGEAIATGFVESTVGE